MNNFDLIKVNEFETSRSVDAIINSSKKLGGIEHDLTKHHNFVSKPFFKRLMSSISQNNVIYYGIMTGEEAINIAQTTGNVKIPVINVNQVRRNVEKLDCNKLAKLKWIHISTLQIILKSTFTLGIDAPIHLQLKDDRLIDQSEALIATGKGNLSCGKLKFNLNLQNSMSLADAGLEYAITLRYIMARKQLMKDGNHPFSITYRINYAITSSHHSLSFRNSEKIEIDELFSPIVSFEAPERSFRFSIDTRIRLETNDEEDHYDQPLPLLTKSQSVRTNTELQPKQLEEDRFLQPAREDRSLRSAIHGIAKELNLQISK